MFENLGRQSVVYIGVQFLSRGLAFLTLPFFARLLGPHEYGILAVCNTTTALASVVVSLGLEVAVLRFYAEYTPDRFRVFLRTVWIWMSVVPLVCVVLMHCLLNSNVSGALSLGWRPHLVSAIWLAYLGAVPGVILAVLRAEGRALEYAVFTLAIAALASLLGLLAVAMGRNGAINVLHGQLTAAGIISFVAHWMCARRLLPLQGKLVVMGDFWSALRMSMPYLPHIWSVWALNASDRWILQQHVPLSSLGEYNIAYTIATIVHVIGTGVMTAFTPAFFRHGEEQDFRSRIPIFFALCVGLYSWVALALSLFAPEIVHLLVGSEYRHAAAMVPVLCLGYWFFVAVYQFSLSLIEYHKRTSWLLVFTGTAAAVNIALNIVLVPRFGTAAAALNTALAFALMGCLAHKVSGSLRPVIVNAEVLLANAGIAVVGYSSSTIVATYLGAGAGAVIKSIALILIVAVMRQYYVHRVHRPLEKARDTISALPAHR